MREKKTKELLILTYLVSYLESEDSMPMRPVRK